MSLGNLYEPAGFAQQASELAQKIMEHHDHLIVSGRLSGRLERKAMMEITEALRASILEPVLSRLMSTGELKEMTGRVANRETDPYSEAEAVAARFLKVEGTT